MWETLKWLEWHQNDSVLTQNLIWKQFWPPTGAWPDQFLPLKSMESNFKCLTVNFIPRDLLLGHLTDMSVQVSCLGMSALDYESNNKFLLSTHFNPYLGRKEVGITNKSKCLLITIHYYSKSVGNQRTYGMLTILFLLI